MATHTFLPVNQKEIQALGWEAPDFIYVTGDAYVDHPSFGPAIISRVLESNGFKVAMYVKSDVPVVVQYSRLDTTQSEMSFMGVMAH